MKDFHRLLHSADQLLKCWEDRLTLNNLALAKRYFKGELRVHVCLSEVDSRADSIQRCAVYQRVLPVSRSDADFHARRVFGPVSTKPHSDFPHLRTEVYDHILMGEADGNKFMVLVDDAELMESPRPSFPPLYGFNLLRKAIAAALAPPIFPSPPD